MQHRSSMKKPDATSKPIQNVRAFKQLARSTSKLIPAGQAEGSEGVRGAARVREGDKQAPKSMHTDTAWQGHKGGKVKSKASKQRLANCSGSCRSPRTAKRSQRPGSQPQQLKEQRLQDAAAEGSCRLPPWTITKGDCQGPGSREAAGLNAKYTDRARPCRGAVPYHRHNTTKRLLDENQAPSKKHAKVAWPSAEIGRAGPYTENASSIAIFSTLPKEMAGLQAELLDASDLQQQIERRMKRHKARRFAANRL